MAGAMWMQGILAFAASEANLDQAAMDASVACHLLPIPVTEVTPLRIVPSPACP